MAPELLRILMSITLADLFSFSLLTFIALTLLFMWFGNHN